MSLNISKIIPQKKSKNRYSLFCNDSFIVGVSDSTLLQYDLRVGKEITHELLAEIQKKEDREAIQNAAFRLLSRRQHSVKELKEKLRKKTQDAQLIDQVILYLIKKNYLNDIEFATAFLKEELKLKKSGPLLIKKKLLQKGIGSELIETLLTDSYPPQLQLKNCQFLAQKKMSILKKQASITQNKLKIANYLKQKGYTWEICEQVIFTLNLGDINEQHT